MPKRTPQHVTADKSRLAFRTVLPSDWVFREPTPDYGIDGEVEIFEDSNATGLLFKVQLKGTTQREKLSVRLSHDKAEYYASLADPVLIVLHHGPSNRIYARWFQSYDPHDEPPAKKSVTLHFGDRDELTATNVGRLRLEVETHRRLRDPRSARPLRLALTRRDDLIAGVPTVAVTATMRDIASRIPGILRFSTEFGDDDLGTLTLQRDAVAVSCRGLATWTIHYPFPWPAEPDQDGVVSDALMAVGLLAHRIGAVESAAQLYADYAAGSSVVTDSDAIAKIANAFTQTHRIRDAINLLETLPDEPTTALLFAMSLTWTARIDSLNSSEQQEVVDYLLRRATREESQGDTRTAAAAHYTLANRLRALHRHDEAVTYYRKAAELDESYPERDYYLGELGGALFESGEYAGAAEMYRLAVERGDRRFFLPLLADSLLMFGDYPAAYEAFKEVMTEEDPAPEWRLKHHLLHRILEISPQGQVRDVEAALYIADVSAAATDEERRERLQEALGIDALCPLAWFNLGLLDWSTGDTTAAFDAFVAAGVFSRIDLEAFARATVLGLVTESPLLPDVVKVAYFFNRSGLIHFLAHDFLLPPEVLQPLLEYVESILDPDENTDRSVLFRLFREDGTYERLEIGLD